MDSSKKVFLSYRRALSVDLAGRIRDHLSDRGYDVFFDIASIPSGKFGEIILGQIEARPLFVPVLVPGCLAQTVKKDDWFCREIEYALEKKRHIVPLASRDFTFETERNRLKAAFPKCIEDLAAYHYIVAYAEYFEAAIEKLVAGLLAVPANIVIRPTPPDERKTVSTLSKAAKVATPDALGKNWLLPPSFKELVIPQSAPKLTLESSSLLGETLAWTAVCGASGYVLERSATSTFLKHEEIYIGKDTKYAALRLFLEGATRYYRVKAKGLFSDGPWSNVVEVRMPEPSFNFGLPTLHPQPFHTLPAPTLSVRRALAPKTLITRYLLSWTAVEKAERYTLERDVTDKFLAPLEIYSGKDTSFEEKVLLLFAKCYYRVRAIPVSGIVTSPWSNIVEIGQQDLS